MSGMVGLPCRTLYSASKFGLSGFGKALRPEVANDGIRILQVYPGYVQTNISKNAMTGDGKTFGKLDDNIKKGMPVEQAAIHIQKAMALNRTEFVVGKLFYHFTCLFAQSQTIIDNYSKSKLKSQIEVKRKA